MKHFLLLFSLVLCVCFGLADAHAQDNLPGEYLRGRDFKGVAFSFAEGEGDIIEAQGVAWGYDTAGEAADAALAYCRSQVVQRALTDRCKVVILGNLPVRTEAELPAVIAYYDAEVLRKLHEELARTGERDYITRLSTTYQKLGRYDDSEALLYELAMGGEHMGQNALAYHWAELNKRLPEALELVDSAIEKDPDYFSYRDTRALVLARLERWNEALASIELAAKLKTHPIVLDHYGDILWLAGQKEKAPVQWQQAIEASGNILFIQRVQKKIRTGMTEDIVFE